MSGTPTGASTLRIDILQEQMTIPSAGNTDRDLQDRVIRFLSDASLHSAQPVGQLLDDSEILRAQRFSRFSARRYYRDRLTRAFRHADVLVPKERTASTLVDSVEFDSVLDRCILGSLATSKQVGDLVASRMLAEQSEIWWAELIEYEKAFFLQLATSETAQACDSPQKAVSTVLREFHVTIPELFLRLRQGGSLDQFHGTSILLFSRTPHGKIYVAEIDERISRVFQVIDGKRSVEEIASLCQLSHNETQGTLSTLSDMGSIMLPLGA
jgi:hypothetical protein